MIKIATIKFQPAGRQYDFNAQSLDLNPGDQVVVETDRGRALATVVIPLKEIDDQAAPDGLKTILRIATEDDLALSTTNKARETDALRYCQKRIQERQMEMKLVRAEYAFDGSRIVFYFTADGRVDFRELVKDLAHHFHTRIEMRQIGVRDEAKLVGGLGVCGRELCCCTFLTDFTPVSVKMAKEQGLALNPSKISGQCGRLLCCLSYEYDTYCHHKKGMPKCGKRVTWQGKEWEVTGQNVLCRRLTLRGADGSSQTISMDRYESDEPEPTPPTPVSPDRGRRERPAGPAGQPEQGSRESARKRPRKPREQAKPPVPEDENKAKPTPPVQNDRPAPTKEEGQPDKRRRRRRRKPRNTAGPAQSKQGE